MLPILLASTLDYLLNLFRLARHYRAEERIFWIFNAILQRHTLSREVITTCMAEYPPLAYATLKKVLDTDENVLERSVRARIASSVIRQIIRSANDFAIAALVALEKLSEDIVGLELPLYCELLWLACHTIRSPQIVQEVLLVLNDSREAVRERSSTQRYIHKHVLGVVFDRMEDAAETCPCDEGGRPKRQRVAPIGAKLRAVEGENTVANDAEMSDSPSARVIADVRVDISSPIRIHSHVRLILSSPAEHSTLPPAVLDALVIRATRGEIMLDVLQPLPPEATTVNWRLYNAGSVATSKAMLDALQRLAIDGFECCHFNDLITGSAEPVQVAAANHGAAMVGVSPTLNESQREAVASARVGWMSLIWGPPGEHNAGLYDHVLTWTCRHWQDHRGRANPATISEGELRGPNSYDSIDT